MFGSWPGDVEAGTGLTCMWVWLVTSGQVGGHGPHGCHRSGVQGTVGFVARCHVRLLLQLLSEFTQCLFGRDTRRRRDHPDRLGLQRERLR